MTRGMRSANLRYVRGVTLALAAVLCAHVGPAATVDAASSSLTIPTSHPRIWWTPERLQRAKQWYAANGFTPRSSDAMGNAFRYVVTGETSYARTAIDLLMAFTVSEHELTKVSSDVYRWNDWVPVVFDWTYNVMTPDERATFMARYSGYVDIMRKKSWGGVGHEFSNYYWGYWRNELTWAIATFHHDPMAQTFLDHALVTRWENSFVPYAARKGAGGVAMEGSQYGRYMLGYPVTAMTTTGLLGRDLHEETDFFRDAVFYLIYTTTTGPTSGRTQHHEVFPFADDETWIHGDSAETFYYGDFATMAATEWGHLPVGQYARRWLNMVTPSRSKHVQAVDPGGAERAFDDLPLDYYAPGPTKFLYAKTSWGPQATALLLQLGKSERASHRHLDWGTFQIRRGDRWLSRETAAYTHKIAGFQGEVVNASRPPAHNTILFNGVGAANAYLEGPPEVTRLETSEHYTYAAVDLSKTYRAQGTPRPDRDDNPYASHIEREFVFVRPLETLVVLDRLESSGEKVPAAEVVKTFITHFEKQPTIEGNNSVLGVNGNHALRVTTLVPSAPTYRVINERDFPDSPEKPIYQFRLEVDTQGSRESDFLHILHAKDASGADVRTRLSEDASTYTVTLEHPTQGNAVIVFNKGLVSSGGAFGYDASAIPGQLTPFLDRVQGIEMTDSGPVWEGTTPPEPIPTEIPPPDDSSNTPTDGGTDTGDTTSPPASSPPTTSAIVLGYEAEAGSVLSAFQTGQDAQASEGAYLATPDNVTVLTKGQTEVRVPITVPADGAYYLWARILGPGEDQDAIYVGFNGVFDRLFPNQLNTYEWIRVETVHRSGDFVHTLTAGLHDITIGHAEPQTRVDAFLVTDDPDLVPTGTSLLTPPPAPTNQSPSVDAGSDQTVILASPATATLQGSAGDDGLPNGALTLAWTTLSGPGPVTFGDASLAITTATFVVPGNYVLQLTGSDGEQTTSDQVAVAVNPAPSVNPPVADAGTDGSVTAGQVVRLNGTGSYDANGDPLTYAWAQDTGPAVSLQNADSAQAFFVAPDVTELTDLGFTLTVSDGQAQVQDSVLITVLPQASETETPSSGSDPVEPDGTLKVALNAITETEATIYVTTEQATTAIVHYGYSDLLAGQVEDQTLALSHTVTLKELTLGSLYHFRVVVQDAGGTETSYPVHAFMTLGSEDLVAPCAVTGFTLEHVDDLTARLGWQAAGDDDRDGTAVAYELLLLPEDLEQGAWPMRHTAEAAAGSAGTSLHTKVANLVPNTTYLARIRARDEAGNWSAWSEIVRVTTQPPIDRQPPVVTSIEATVDRTDQALVTWSTDEPTTGLVLYGTNSNQLDLQYQASGLAPTHTGALESLQPATRYYYQVQATDATGNQASSLIRFFDTLEPDTTPPASIQDLRPVQVTETLAELVWTSPGDDGSQGQAAAYDIRYHPETLSDETWAQATLLPASQTPTPAPAGSLEQITLTGLASGTWAVGIQSLDASGNRSARSNVVTVTIPEPVVEPPPPPAPEPEPEPELDTTGPTISDLKVIRAGANLQISWTTDEPARSQVEYWLPYDKSHQSNFKGSFSGSSTTKHSTVLQGLGRIQIHIELRVWVEDEAGNRTVSKLIRT